jgi:ankyrin repeat protein
MSKRSGATLRHRPTKAPRRDAMELPTGSKFLDLPLELRHHIYADLIYPGLPGSRSALTVTNRQLREEVHDWLAGQKMIIHVKPWQDDTYTAPPWYEPVLKRATNIEFDLSCLPQHPSHPMIDMLCRLWREECHLKQVNYTVLDNAVPPRKCLYRDDGSNFPDTLPSPSKKLLCEWLLHPINVILAKRRIQPLHTFLIWRQPESPLMSESYLGSHYQNDEATAMLLQTSTEQAITQSDAYHWAPLVHAIRYGYRAIVEVLLGSVRLDLNKATTPGKTLLTEAFRREHVQIVDMLLHGLGSDEIEEALNRQDLQGRTVFSHTAQRTWCQQETVRYLLEKRADPNLQDHQGMTPLLYAVSYGRKEVVKMLCLSEKVNVLARDVRGRMILHLGAQRGDLPLFKLLLQQRGMEVDTGDASKRTALSYAAQHERVAFVKILLDSHDALVDAPDNSGRTPLSHAAEHNGYRATDLLLEAGAQCNSEDTSGRTPLFYAVQAGHLATTKRLVERMKDGNTALVLAGKLKQAKVEEKLLEMDRADTNLEKGSLRELLLQSSRAGRDSIVRLILHLHEVEADARDVDGRTPLSHAAERGSLNIIKILSRSNANRDLKDNRGHRPVDYARQHGDKTHQCICKDWMSDAEFYRRREPGSRQ